MYRPATKKQQGYYKSLTNDWLPRKCSAQRASELIEKAKRGEIAKREITVRVSGQRIHGWNGVGDVFFCVERDYYPVGQHYATFEAAEAFARTILREGEKLELDRVNIREICTD